MRAVLALALALGAAAPWQSEAPVAPQPTLDVVVLDPLGRSVGTLTPQDFSVTERGVRRAIGAARFVQPARPDARLFGILLDEYHVTPGPAADRLRDALARFVREDLAPGDLVVVLKPLDSLLEITPTADREAAARGIEHFQPRRGDYVPRTPFEKEFMPGAPARVDVARARISASSLTALAAGLGSLGAARKTLILVSEGIPPGSRARGEEAPFGVRAAVVAANRAHVAIYPLSPTGTEETAESLRALASDTTGRVLPGGAATGTSLRSVLSEASGYYVITLSRAATTEAAGLHAVDVAVRPGGLTVRARTGYWTPTAWERRTAAESDAVPRAASFASRIPLRSSPLIRPWFGMSRGEAGATRVSFVWEPAARVPGDRHEGPVPARVALSVATLEGASVFEGIVLPSNGSMDPAYSRQARASFEIPSGRWLVRMAIEDSTAHVIDRDVRDLVVGGFSGPVALGSVEVLRARTAREQKSLTDDPDAPPVATRQFSRAERLLIRVPVITSGPAPSLAARLVSGFGGVIRELPTAPVASRPGLYQIDLPLAALAAGAYSVDISASTPEGAARDSLPFRVTP